MEEHLSNLKHPVTAIGKPFYSWCISLHDVSIKPGDVPNYVNTYSSSIPRIRFRAQA